MFVLEADQPPILSPSDLRLASACEFALLASVDVRLGRSGATEDTGDVMLDRIAALGDAHEQALLRELRSERKVVGVARPDHSRAGYEAAARQTLDLLGGDADVIHQGVLFDGRFLGFPDFLVRDGDAWTVVDAKLARGETVAALLQVAAYADALRAAGVRVSPEVRLALGDGDVRGFALDDITPVLHERRARLEHILESHLADGGPVQWGDERWLACTRCESCLERLEQSRDVLLVAGVHGTGRAHLVASGVRTIEDLAARTDPVSGLEDDRLAALAAQARLQLAQERDPQGRVVAEIHQTGPLSVLPAPSEGDLFFDFEGDPLWRERGSRDDGLEYLFGVVEAPVDDEPPAFRAFWAHDRPAEKQALIDFLAYVKARRERWPDLHIYHYAPYERTALLRLAVRHGVGEAEVDDLLRDGVLVDLYAVVKGAVRVSQRSYSLKKLEPLYMGADLRSGEVTTAGDSIVVYHEYTQAVSDGRADRAAELLEQIRDYNEYDCRSTLGLRDWLLARAADHGVEVGRSPAPPREPEEPNELETRLRSLVPDHGPRTPEQQAIAMLAATVLYNRRENKPYWWSHFDRLRQPVHDWVRSGEVFHVTAGEVVQDWHKASPRQRNPRRVVRVTGRFAAAPTIRVGGQLHTVYDPPLPEGITALSGHVRATGGHATVVEHVSGDHDEVLLVEEMLPAGATEHATMPLALTPTPGPATTTIDAVLEDLARGVADADGALPEQSGVDLLRRRPPRLRSGPLPPVGTGPEAYAHAVTASLLDLDRSYLAVQGPPGTGKTHVAAQVITRLVRDHGWRIGVVAQSHAAVENVLSAVVRAGLDPALVAKDPRAEASPVWTVIGKDDVRSFCADHEATGYVIGGTVWDLTNPRRLDRDQLDLVVVDEAGQYSLAWTVACSTAGSRLLLLGDPRQLPQVSQGTHPEPVDTSALDWLLDTSPVLPARFGYFLERSWRMHPALAERVSALSYAGALHSHEAATTARHLEGIAPGVHVELVDHHDNTTSSPEEAARVVHLVRGCLGRRWSDPAAGPDRPLGESDILVVTPYNAQVHEIEKALRAAGFDGVSVGTMDRFQGQEAPVVIVSMAASAAGDVARGLGFLLSRNRLNVAISRGQWAAYLVRSEVLTDFAPRSTRELLALGAFIGLCSEDAAATVALGSPSVPAPDLPG